MNMETDELKIMEGYDDCIIGVVDMAGSPPRVCYSINKIIGRLMADGMSREEAEEYFEFNQLGAYVGEGTPCFLEEMSLTEIVKRQG